MDEFDIDVSTGYMNVSERMGQMKVLVAELTKLCMGFENIYSVRFQENKKQNGELLQTLVLMFKRTETGKKKTCFTLNVTTENDMRRSIMSLIYNGNNAYRVITHADKVKLSEFEDRVVSEINSRK